MQFELRTREKMEKYRKILATCVRHESAVSLLYDAVYEVLEPQTR